MSDRYFVAGFARCYPFERRIPLKQLAPAVRRLELALAYRSEDGARLRKRGCVEHIALETLTPLNTCKLCGRLAPSTRNYCDDHLALGIAGLCREADFPGQGDGS